MAIVMREPAAIWVPEANTYSLSCHHSNGPDSHPLLQEKGDLDIMAAIIAGIAGVTMVVLTQTAATVDTVNLSKSAEVLQAQEVLNQHL